MNKTISDEFEYYINMLHDGLDKNSIQFAEIEKAFFAGAMIGIDSIIDATNLEEDEGIEKVKCIRQEVKNKLGSFLKDRITECIIK